MSKSSLSFPLSILALSCMLFTGCGGSGAGGGSGGGGGGSTSSSDFSLALSPSSILLIAGGSTTVQASITPKNGFAGEVSLSAGNLPAGVSISPTLPQNISSSGLTLTITAAASVPANNYSLQLTATSGSLQHMGTEALTVSNGAGTIPGNRTNWVRLGSNPIAVYYDAPRNHLLASMPALNRVAVLDPVTGNLLSTIPVSVAGNEPNGVWLASSSNLSGSLDGNSLYVIGAGHIATIDLASQQVVKQQSTPEAIFIGWTTPSAISPTFIRAAENGHMVFGSWGDSSFYHWDGVSALASLHSISDLYSFDRNFDGSKVLVISGDTGAGYQLLDVASDTIALQGNYANAVLMTVRGNPVREEWALANSNGIDFLDGNLNLIARVPATLVGSSTYWGMTYSADGKYLYFVYAPNGLPFLVTVDTSTYQTTNIAPATGTDIPYLAREPPEWITQAFAADSGGLVFGLGQKGLVIDDATYTVDPSQAMAQDSAILAMPDNGLLNAWTAVQITTQSYPAEPDIWFGNQRASAQGLNSFGQAQGTTPPGQTAGPVNIKLFPAAGYYTHVMPQAFTYGTIITSVRNSICVASGGCSADIFGFGLFGTDTSQTSVTIGGNPAAVQLTSYFSTPAGYPYPLQFVTVTVPPGMAGRANVVVKTGVGQATLAGGFRYASSLQSYSSPQPYNALLFDEKRQILYATTNSQIVRFSASSANFLSPMTPPSLTGQNQLEAMALTPDGSQLLVANESDNSVAVIDPDNPTSAQAVAVPATPSTGSPIFVAATSTGKALISMTGSGGPLYELDLGTMQVTTVTINGLFTGNGARLSATSDGSNILFRGYAGANGLWNDAQQRFSPVFQNYAGAGLGSAAGDGNVFGVGEGFIAPDGTSMTAVSIPDEMGGFQSWEPNDSALNDSGSLEFAPGETSVFGPPGLFILDTHHGDVLGNIVLQNQINDWVKTLAVDSTAQRVFMADSQGLTVLTLAAAPLAVGWLNPAIASTAGSTSITLRGSGFQTGTTVTIGGKAASAVYVDANTLQITAPANSAGAAQVTVQNPDGETYSLDAALTYQ